MRRLTILLATAAALMLVPAAQAMAESPEFVHVAGSGSGEVSSVGGLGVNSPFGPIWEGSPPIECNYASPGPATGTCEDEMSLFEEFGIEGVWLIAVPAPGSEFGGYTIEEGELVFGESCKSTPGPITGKEKEETEASFGPESTREGAGAPCFLAPEGGSASVTVTFDKASSGPTNRRTLTVTKAAGGPGPVGTVSSKPKGINCATACNEATASMYKGTAVVLKEKPATGDTFSHWTGACSGSAETCTVPMAADEEVGAVFAGTSKAIVNPKALTLTKAGSGLGTVKAAGLACESECSGVAVLYQGPVFTPKFKAGKTVELKETPAYGSSFTGWSGACSGSEPACKVTMEEAASVTAEFTAKPKTTLTIEKNSYETGTGTVSSKPKGLNCATACTTQAMSVPSGETIVLKGKAAAGMTLTGWTGCESTTTVSAIEGTCTVKPSSATTVKATFSGAPKAIVNPKALTLTKAGSGLGTVKAAGLACEAECTTATVLFGGPVFTPKFKPGKTVLLKATSAPGSGTVSWSGCLEEPTPAECVVVMEEDSSVTATFDELE